MRPTSEAMVEQAAGSGPGEGVPIPQPLDSR